MGGVGGVTLSGAEEEEEEECRASEGLCVTITAGCARKHSSLPTVDTLGALNMRRQGQGCST